MEPAKIDWKRIDSIFVEDKLYENINAPKWVDFLSPDDDESVDFEAWFCRPDCNHPKTADDFCKTTTSSKLSSLVNKIRSPLSDRSQRDARLKRRGPGQSSSSSGDKPKFNEDSENQNPNLLAPPPIQQAKFMKELIKSSSEKKQSVDVVSQTNEAPRLKSTLSARNLFGGKDILSQVTEFCNELKKMAIGARERENDQKLNERERQEGEKKDEVDVKVKERTPLLELSTEKSEGMERGSVKEKQRRKRIIADPENIPVSLNLEYVKHKGEERLQQIRINPPSPQCFSAIQAPTKSTPSKGSKSRLMERGILQEVKQDKAMVEEIVNKDRSLSIVDGREPKNLDVFWFLKPCT